ncbi:hypothetical protein FAZ95_31370 [Trinickia violacea]|uniref:Uncharacterized protein n=1 Tax=Trinickia violacea TaxID=2571746 RepID=A0A4P8J0V2_9BURK|nr:hypothetical protein [Trinickia violacea]QCP53543.1 hypothetical protein FAZ95_31370 [Trinickia violacea]
MADYQLTVQLPPKRTGKTPDCDSWTFHHILPWKYYYCLAAVLGYYYAGSLNSFVRSSPLYNTPQALAELPNTVTALGSIVTCDSDIVHSAGKSMMSFVEVKNVIDKLARTADSVTERITNATSKETLHAALVSCTSPVFGGFPGMSGDQRSDDPKDANSKMEPTKPFNGDPAWWTAVTSVGHALQAASYWAKPSDRNGCKDLDSAGYGDKVKFKLSNESLDVILAHLRSVTTPTHNNQVLAFDEKSWLVQIPNGTWGMTVSKNEFLYGAGAAVVPTDSYKFKVSSVDAHAGKTKLLEMTRCPGLENEKNILKPTSASAKIITSQT